MGSTVFWHEAEDYSAEEAFNALVSEAVRDYGCDEYNGTISTCELTDVMDFSGPDGKFTEGKLAAGEEYMRNDGYGEKWEATCLDLGIVGYDIITVKKIRNIPKVKAEFRQKYAVLPAAFASSSDPSLYCDTKTEADELAVQMTLKNNVEYCVAKRPVKVNHGEDIVTNTTFSIRRKKSEPKPCPKNSIVKPVHKYLFYGLAAC